MSINTREYTFIGNTYAELVQAFFSAIAKYSNMTAEGVYVSSSNVYEYFKMKDTLYPQMQYRLCFNAYMNGYTLRAGPARSNSANGDMVTYTDINSGSHTKYKQYGGKLYSHCRMFYEGEDKFIGSTGLYGDNYDPVLWFGIFHDEREYPVFYKLDTTWLGANELYHMTYLSGWGTIIYEPETNTNDLSLNHETSDTVYIEKQCYQQASQNVVVGYLPEVYSIYNNSFYRIINNKRIVNTLLLINTEMGQFLSLRPNVWLKIGTVGEHVTVIYNG